MSRLIKFTGVAILMSVLIILGAPLKKANAQPNVSVSFQMFYNNLQPYGQWIDYGQHGYCWIPNNVGPNFRPYYSNGHWVMTDYGNTWVSDYSWGWAPFHYGRWTFDDYYGWIWVPGNTWGPAWVSWRNGGGYYGWAPMAPGINVNIAVGPRSYCGNDWWVFIPQRQIYNTHFHRYWRGPRYNTTIINRTTIINNTYVRGSRRYVAGPRRSQIQQVTGRPVRTYGVRSGMKAGRSQVRGNTLSVYNPNVRSRANERPQRLASNVRSSGNRPATYNSGNTRNPRTVTQRSNVAQQRATTNRTNYGNTRGATSRNNTVASRQQQQQQRKITDRRQQSWQQSRQPARNQTVNRSRSQQSRATTYNRTQANRNTQRARTQTRPTQRTSATQSRPQTSSRSTHSSSRSNNSNRGSRSSSSRGRR